MRFSLGCTQRQLDDSGLSLSLGSEFRDPAPPTLISMRRSGSGCSAPNYRLGVSSPSRLSRMMREMPVDSSTWGAVGPGPMDLCDLVAHLSGRGFGLLTCRSGGVETRPLGSLRAAKSVQRRWRYTQPSWTVGPEVQHHVGADATGG